MSAMTTEVVVVVETGALLEGQGHHTSPAATPPATSVETKRSGAAARSPLAIIVRRGVCGVPIVRG